MEFTRVRMSNSLSVALAMALVFLQLCSSSFGEENPQKNNNKLSVNDEKCDMYQGSWIFDDSYPLYNSSTCPFIRKEFDCLKYGRLDHSYLKYRWQPRNCDLPRFDGQKMLESLKGKKIMFVGDSISLNQWESLLCLINSALPQINFTTQNNSSVSSVVFEDYEVSFFLMTSHYLVDIEEETQGRVLKLDSLKNGDSWKEMDVLVFNSWLWWFRRDQWDYIQYGDTIVKNMDLMEAYRMGLTTWANWVDSSVDQEKTKVFFQGISPSHYNGTDWNKPNVTNCGEENEPISGSIYSTGLPRASYVVEDVLGRIKYPVHLLNITTLSQLRKDGHPSRYNAFKGMDCTHWCIAGVQDTWNQILYALLTS